MESTLCDLPDDVLIYTIAFLSVTDILLLRQRYRKATHRVEKRIQARCRLKQLSYSSQRYRFRVSHASCLSTRVPLARKFSSNPEATTAQMGAHGIQGDLVCPDHLGYARQQKCSERSPKGVIVTGVKLKAEPESEASVTVSSVQGIVLLHLDNYGIRHEIHSIDTDLRPITLSVDDVSKTLIYNWKTDERSYLDDVGDTPHDHCLQVVFTLTTTLVVRALSITVYNSTFTGIATHSFGWVDGASATPTSILVCSKSHHDAELFDAPTSSSSHWEERDGSETLITAVFPGPLNRKAEVRVREVCKNALNNWAVVDYDEDLGRIALGSAFGNIVII
ncbi:hypothetical protein ARMGADRAFT_1086887 [Armillaria gallica]|uniref:F-box domain-containing protein n=1 Tax=Armillaria gallica TaxID=47427 RepID=A0A2H3D414_ARMGA|nr:hypothetical protein ARMGADRAFT_1086887 [Armillaria gallica]